MWETRKFPESWEPASVIPIPKPGKDHAEPYNYRQIALTSSLCKKVQVGKDQEKAQSEKDPHPKNLRQND